MSSILKVDTIQDQDGNNIINESANTITIGASGDTITIPSGATFASIGIDDNATSTAITINSSGNVGIGESNPGNNLVVDGGANTTIRVQNDTPYYGDFQATTTGIQIRTVGSYPLILNTNQTERMRILHTGNVGIGTSSPGRTLHVKSGASTTIRVDGGTDGSHAAFFESAIGGTVHYQFGVTDNSNNFSIYDSQNAATRFLIDSSGRVGIGTSSPSLASGNGIVISGGSSVARLELRNTTSGTTSSDGGFLTYFANDLFLGNRESGNSIFYTNNTERMRIDSSGNVGIGTSSPSSLLHIYSSSPQMIIQDGGTHGTNSSPGLVFKDSSSSQGEIGFENSGEMFIRQLKNSDMTFRTNNTERMRIYSSGLVAINTTSPDAGSIVSVNHEGSSFYGLSLNSTTTSGTQYHLRFARGGAGAGYIASNSATTVTLNNTSDERLKENVQNSNSAIQDLKDIQVRQFDWKDNIDTHRDFGFVAQELVNVVPEAVTQGTDELDDNGKPVRSWGVDYSHIVPRLVKVCQEQQTKIEELEARITALETNQP